MDRYVVRPFYMNQTHRHTGLRHHRQHYSERCSVSDRHKHLPLGVHHPYILVDTGNSNGAYVPVLNSALIKLGTRPFGSGVRSPGSLSSAEMSSLSSYNVPLVSDIIIAHAHLDHCGCHLDVHTLLRDLNLDLDIPPQSQPLPNP